MPAAKSKKSAPSATDLLALALEIIAENGWLAFSFSDLAKRADIEFTDVRAIFKDRTALVDALSLHLDEAMLGIEREELADLPPRDRVFELMMSRIEAMAPHREGLIRLAQEARRDPELAIKTACRLDRSMAWLQDAAGLRSNGLRPRLARHLLTGVYLKTLSTWAADDSADLAKTMTSLDKDLRRVEMMAGLGDHKQ